MKSKTFFTLFGRLTGDAAPGRLANVRHGLSITGLYPKSGTVTAKDAAWLLFVAACCKTTERAQLRAWIQQKALFFERLRQMGETDPITYLTNVLSDAGARSEIKAIAIERLTGAIMAQGPDGFEMVVSMSDTPPPPVPNCMFLSRGALNEIAKGLAVPAPELN